MSFIPSFPVTGIVTLFLFFASSSVEAQYDPCEICGEAWSDAVTFTNPSDPVDIPNFGTVTCGLVETFAAGGTVLDESLCADAQILSNVCICSNGGPVPDNPPCYLCGSEDARFTNPDDMTDALGLESTCGNFETLALGGSLTPSVCEQSKDIIASDCFCQPGNDMGEGGDMDEGDDMDGNRDDVDEGDDLDGGQFNDDCDMGPNALTDVYGYNIPQTCFPFGEDGTERCFYTLVPECAIGEEVPLVLDIHGLTSCPLTSSTYTGWRQKAFEECFVLVWPLGQIDRNVADSNCWANPGGLVFDDGFTTVDCCCEKESEGPFYQPDPIDPDFIREVVTRNVDVYNQGADSVLTIDTTRIYMAGHSNGCITSLATAALHSDIVAAVCCHSGTLTAPLSDDYEAVPTWLVHGVVDDVIPYGGVDFGALFGVPGLGFAGVRVVTDYLADQNGCDAGMETTPVTDGTSHVVGTSYKHSSNCQNGADVELIALHNAGHIPYHNIETPVDTTAMAWNFCSAHKKDTIPLAFAQTTEESDTVAPITVPVEEEDEEEDEDEPIGTTIAPSPALTPAPTPAPTSSAADVIAATGFLVSLLAGFVIA